MANCHKCGKTKLNKNSAGQYACRHCGPLRRTPIIDYAPVHDNLKQSIGVQT